MHTIPHIKKDEQGITSLYVHGKPFIGLGGEIHNSSSSNLKYMEKQVWPYIKDLHMNLVIAPIFWETIEPAKGEFDFTLLDGLIQQARNANVKLQLLWFGLWKNGESFYTPSWVKEDSTTYFRACYSQGNPSNTVSPLCEAGILADAAAFTKVMEHLKEIDGEENTVIIVQVENEIGFLKSQRDYSSIAQSEYDGEIPQKMKEIYHVSGSWYEAFGEQAPELFMAYHYAQAIETIASSGKAMYPLPMTVNAWLEQFPEIPGEYPSGGPIARLIPLWKRLAPSIDVLTPDIYVSDFKGVCDAFTTCDNPLFIPEARRDPVTASNVFYALGQYHALAFSPFGIEDMMNDTISGNTSDPDLLKTLNIEVSGFTCTGTGPYLQKSYEVLSNVTELLLQYRGCGKVHAFIKKNEHDKGIILPLEKYDIKLTYTARRPLEPGSAGIIIETSPDEFYIMGCHFKIEVLPKKGSEKKVCYVAIKEGHFENSSFVPGRILNGDECMEAYMGPMARTLSWKVCLY